MRVISLILLGAAVASCTTAPAEPSHSAKGQQELQELVAGKVAQPAVSCLPYYHSNSGDMTVIDQSTVAFRTGPGRVYVAHMLGSCNNLGSAGPYALVTHQSGTGQLCHGDIAEVVDTLAHVTVGSCAFGDFVPYVKPGA